ncbi:hypothetical protein OSB04_025306 [Centaurea solstitialis]|uniref:Integrase catalytic domain-containing protein n=1 Tax=Centaurea solstitialis TaxID=347529 RepID=A0AA38WCY6_9ASTR|nr:hypothetical protein OSB04_025306 [Centaurea solstitialis]
MGLLDKFENVRPSLLYRHPLSSLEDAINKLLSEETRLQLHSPAPTEFVFYTNSSAKPRGKPFNNSFDCPQNAKNRQSVARSVGPSEPMTVPFAGSVSSSPDLMDLMRKNQELMAQLMTGSLGMNSSHSPPSGTFWIFDSDCFNHMTPYPSGFVSKQRSSHSTVRTADLTPKHVLFSGDFSRDPKTKQTLGVGRRVGRVLEVIYICLPLQSPNFVVSVSSTASFDLWHARLGSLGNVSSESISSLSCKLGKHHALLFDNNDFTFSLPFDLIHSNMWGPAPHPSMGGARYFVIFVDDHTRFTWIYLMKHRSELPHIYITFVRMILTQFSKPIKILRADNAMEYKESSLLLFLQSQAKCSERFWGEAAFTTVYTISRHPTPTLKNKSSYEELYGVSPAYELLKVWGCACFVQLQSHEYNKLEPRGHLCCFLGYGIEHKGYHRWDPISKRLRISRHVTFWEHVPFFTMPSSESSSLNHVPSQRSTPEPSVESADPGPSQSKNVRRSDRVRQVPNHLHDYHCYATLLSNHEPTSYKEASSSSHWQGAMQEELQALTKAQTWDYVPLSLGKRPIGSKWVFKMKTKSDGSIDRYKARLVAKGFNQEYGIDYEETFAHVARVTSVRSLLAIAATKPWPLF